MKSMKGAQEKSSPSGSRGDSGLLSTVSFAAILSNIVASSQDGNNGESKKAVDGSGLGSATPCDRELPVLPELHLSQNDFSNESLNNCAINAIQKMEVGVSATPVSNWCSQSQCSGTSGTQTSSSSSSSSSKSGCNKPTNHGGKFMHDFNPSNKLATSDCSDSDFEERKPKKLLSKRASTLSLRRSSTPAVGIGKGKGKRMLSNSDLEVTPSKSLKLTTTSTKSTNNSNSEKKEKGAPGKTYPPCVLSGLEAQKTVSVASTSTAGVGHPVKVSQVEVQIPIPRSDASGSESEFEIFSQPDTRNSFKNCQKQKRQDVKECKRLEKEVQTLKLESKNGVDYLQTLANKRLELVRQLADIDSQTNNTIQTITRANSEIVSKLERLTKLKSRLKLI